MGRPPALDDRQKAEIGRRLAQGESLVNLAKEFKVGVTTLKRNLSDRVPKIRNAAMALAQAEVVVSQMDLSDQTAVRSLADHLKGIGQNAAKAAATGMQSAVILQGKALKAIQGLGDESTVEDLRLPDALLTVAGKASALGTQLMQANKDAGKATGQTLEDLITGAAS